MRARVAAAFVVVLAWAAAAHAAPWSLELPAGYTEQPGAADAEVEQLRKVARTVSVDAQVYVSPDGNVRLTRMTWLSKFDVTPGRGSLDSLDRGVASGGAKHATKNISATRELVGEQLIGEQLLDVDGTRVHMKRIYAADTANVVHMFTVVCAGPAEQLADCEKAQASMQLTLPNQASLSGAPADEETSIAYVLGFATGVLVVVLAVVWLIRRARTRR
jgi:hypothetical protein